MHICPLLGICYLREIKHQCTRPQSLVCPQDFYSNDIIYRNEADGPVVLAPGSFPYIATDPSATELYVTYRNASSENVLIHKSVDGNEVDCGDANGDGQVNVGDAVYLIGYIFKQGPAPDPECLGDANGDAGINVGDVVYLIAYIFKSGPAPVEDCCP